MLEYKAKLESLSVSSGSYGGHFITLPGKGFDYSTDVKLLASSGTSAIACEKWLNRNAVQFRCPAF